MTAPEAESSVDTVTAVQPDLTDDFRHLTPAGIARFRERLGVDIASTRMTTWNERATRDGIRHFALGFGDDNPLWCDPSYAAASRWGSVVAPPAFLESAGISPHVEVDPERKARARGALSRVPSLWTADRICYFAPVREDDSVWVRCFYVSIDDVPSSSGTVRSAVSVRRRVFWNGGRELLAIWDSEFVHREATRSGARRASTAAGRSSADAVDGPPVDQPYDHDAISQVEDSYSAEVVRGAESRYLEDISPGDPLETRLRGPLTVADMIAWLSGCGRHELYPYRVARKNRLRTPTMYARNRAGAWESAVRVHWDDDFARTAGAPRAFDYATLRNAWAMQLVTDWMGDDAVVVGFDGRIMRFNLVGDLTKLTGEVTAVENESGHPEAVLTVRCTNQRDELTATATIRVRLPSRRLGLPAYPEAPAGDGLLEGMPAPSGGPWSV